VATSAIPQPRSLKRSFVTPEGVDLKLELGSAGSRAGAFLIDALIMIVLLVVVTILLLLIAGKSTGTGEFLVVLWLIGFFLLRNGWFSLFEMGSRGATPGKRLMGLRVVRESGARMSTGQAIVRQLPLFTQMYWIDVLFALFTDKHQRAFELLSKTRVVVVMENQSCSSRCY